MKRDVAAILFLKLGQITIRLTFLGIYLLCKFDEPSYGGQNCSQPKHLQAWTSHGLFLHFEALGPIIREI